MYRHRKRNDDLYLRCALLRGQIDGNRGQGRGQAGVFAQPIRAMHSQNQRARSISRVSTQKLGSVTLLIFIS